MNPNFLVPLGETHDPKGLLWILFWAVPTWPMVVEPLLPLRPQKDWSFTGTYMMWIPLLPHPLVSPFGAWIFQGATVSPWWKWHHSWNGTWQDAPLSPEWLCDWHKRGLESGCPDFLPSVLRSRPCSFLWWRGSCSFISSATCGPAQQFRSWPGAACRPRLTAPHPSGVRAEGRREKWGGSPCDSLCF